MFDPLEKEMATCSSILVWETPQTEEPGKLLGSQRIGHNWAINTFHIYIYVYIYFLAMNIERVYLRYADDTTLMAESEEELKSLLLKEESQKVGLKLNIQKTKIVASGPITSW